MAQCPPLRTLVLGMQESCKLFSTSEYHRILPVVRLDLKVGRFIDVFF